MEHFHLSPHENILTIALINIHYLYNIKRVLPGHLDYDMRMLTSLMVASQSSLSQQRLKAHQILPAQTSPVKSTCLGSHYKPPLIGTPQNIRTSRASPLLQHHQPPKLKPALIIGALHPFCVKSSLSVRKSSADSISGKGDEINPEQGSSTRGFIYKPPQRQSI